MKMEIVKACHQFTHVLKAQTSPLHFVRLLCIHSTAFMGTPQSKVADEGGRLSKCAESTVPYISSHSGTNTYCVTSGVYFPPKQG